MENSEINFAYLNKLSTECNTAISCTQRMQTQMLFTFPIKLHWLVRPPESNLFRQPESQVQGLLTIVICMMRKHQSISPFRSQTEDNLTQPHCKGRDQNIVSTRADLYQFRESADRLFKINGVLLITGEVQFSLHIAVFPGFIAKNSIIFVFCKDCLLEVGCVLLRIEEFLKVTYVWWA